MKMKACELMAKAATDSEKFNGKKYKVLSGAIIDRTGKEYSEFIISENGTFTSLSGLKLRLYVSNYGEVEEIKQSVSVLEAVMAYHKGEPIWIELNGIKHSYCQNDPTCFTRAGFMLSDENGRAVSSGELLEGKWYIGEVE